MRRFLRLRTASYGFLLLVLMAFPYGPLFPWSPVTPGYERLQLSRADVYYPSGTALPDAYRQMDRLIRECEEFHRLPMTRRMTVVACRDWSDFKRFMTHLSGAVGAATLDTGTVIYVTPKIAERHFDLAEFLRHELSHAALRQNQSLYHAFTMRNQEWFNEGLAVSFGRQKSYLSDEEFLERAREQDLGPVIDPEQHAASGPLDMRFNYPAWRYFLEYMIEQRGRDRFQTYLAGFLDRPQAYRDLFANVYGRPFPDAIRGFQNAIREGRWKPGAR